MKKYVLVGVLSSLMFVNTGCEPEEVRAGAAGVAIGIGLGMAMDNDHYTPDRPRYNPPPPPRHPRPRHPRGPRHGGHYGPGYGHGGYNGPGYGHGGYRPYDNGIALMSTKTSAAKSQTKDFAHRHNISLNAATKIERSFKNVNAQGMTAFHSIGLGEVDVRRITQRRMPEPQSLARMAKSLDMSEAQARDLVKYMIVDFDAQAKDINSPYWRSCMAKGKWKTPQNALCTKTYSKGCVPATGATLCL